MISKKTFNGFKIFLLLFALLCNPNFAQSVVVNPNPAHIGHVPVGSSEVQNFLLLNYSVNSKNVSNITITGDAAGKFAVVDNPVPFSIDAFGEYVFSVEYTPTEQTDDVALMQIEAGSETIIDTLRGSGTTIYNGVPTFERLIGLFHGDLDVGGVWTISLDQAPDKSYVIVGTTTLVDNISPDVYLIKTDQYGKQLWDRTFEAGTGGGSYDSGGDQGWDAVTLNDGSILVLSSGNSMGPGDVSVILSKWDSEGNFVWEQAYGGRFNDIGYKMTLDSQGNLLIAGSTNNTSDQTENAYILKINPSDGTLIWEKNYAENGGIQSAFDVAEAQDGGYVFIGNNQQQGETANVSFTKIDAGGNEIWNRTFTSPVLSEVSKLQSTSDGGYIAAGYSLTNAKGKDGYLIKVDANGNKIWENTFGTEHADYFKSVTETSGGGYLAAGAINAFFSVERRTDDFWLLKVDADGTLQWQKQFGGNENDAATEILKSAEGGYSVVGMSASFTVESRVYFMEVNSDGYITGMSENADESVRNDFSLLQNYPNPFNPATNIEFIINQGGETTLKVYDILGREVAELINQKMNPGNYKVIFDGKNLVSGIYFYKLKSGKKNQVKK